MLIQSEPEITITHNGHLIEVFKLGTSGVFTAKWVKDGEPHGQQGYDLSALVKEAQRSLDTPPSDTTQFFNPRLGEPWRE